MQKIVLKECTCTISRGSVWGIIITLMVSMFSYFSLVIHMRSFLLAPWHLSALLFTQRHHHLRSLLTLCLRVESCNLVLLPFSPQSTVIGSCCIHDTTPHTVHTLKHHLLQHLPPPTLTCSLTSISIPSFSSHKLINMEIKLLHALFVPPVFPPPVGDPTLVTPPTC